MNFNVVLCGSANAGKSALITRFTQDVFTHSRVPTIGVDFQSITVESSAKVPIRFQFTDLAGQERFRSVTGNFFRKAEVVLLVLDVSITTGADHVGYWLDFIKLNCSSSEIPVFLLANKIDVCEDYDAAIRFYDVDDVALSQVYAQNLFCVSAKTSVGIKNLFRELISIAELTEQHAEHAQNILIDGERDPSATTPPPPTKNLIQISSTSDGKVRIMGTRRFLSLAPSTGAQADARRFVREKIEPRQEAEEKSDLCIC